MPGVRCRVTTQDCTLRDTQVTVMAQKGDTLILRDQRHTYFRLPAAQIVNLDVSARANRNPAYMLYGCVIGGTTGYLVSRLAIDNEGSNEFAPLALLLGLPLGTATGGLLGYYIGKERWESLHLQDAPLSFFIAPCQIFAHFEF